MEPERPLRTWRLFQLEIELGEGEEVLRGRALRELGLESGDVRGFRIARKALDARRRGGVHRLRWVCHVDVVLDARRRTRELERLQRTGRVRPAPRLGSLVAGARHPSLGPGTRAVVVGSGPAGLFAALVLARNGVAVALLERGPPLEQRSRKLARFHHRRELDPEGNLLFGEGGAGTYSDGKIYTRVDDALEVPLLEELVACGAPPSIVYDSLAHIGTDRLHRILPALRARMRAQGVDFVFDTRVDELGSSADEPGRVLAVRTTRGEFPCDALFLAPGHSARDTWEALARQGVRLEPKPFQLGLRIEHPQELIDRGRYGSSPLARGLGAAAYNLVCRAGDGAPSAFSFCMCPGGRIVASVNEPGLLCTNGMSNSKHSSAWATSALVTTFGPEHFGPGAFDGVSFQRDLERRFFEAGGSDYTAPAQSAADFLAGRETRAPRHSTYPFGTTGARLDQLLPELATASLARALREFDRQIPGFAGGEGLFVGLESRSSGPVRMPRDRESFLASGFQNLYPIGEGAGWAGGIMSAALDGANAALALVTQGVHR
jgi:uncharacterized protein